MFLLFLQTLFIFLYELKPFSLLIRLFIVHPVFKNFYLTKNISEDYLNDLFLFQEHMRILIIISQYVLRKFIKNECGVFLLHLFSIFQKKRSGPTYINSLSFELYLFFFLRQGVCPFSFIILLSFWTWKTIFDISLQPPPFPHHTQTIDSQKD